MWIAKMQPDTRGQKEKGQMLQWAMNQITNIGAGNSNSPYLPKESFIAERRSWPLADQLNG
jgi:hypothetical protein